MGLFVRIVDYFLRIDRDIKKLYLSEVERVNKKIIDLENNKNSTSIEGEDRLKIESSIKRKLENTIKFCRSYLEELKDHHIETQEILEKNSKYIKLDYEKKESDKAKLLYNLKSRLEKKKKEVMIKYTDELEKKRKRFEGELKRMLK